MLTTQRRKAILEKLKQEKKVIVSELSELFAVSDETIRRDLDLLCQEGYAIKGYGGAVLNENDLPVSIRKIQNPEQKKKIAALVEPLVSDGESIILDASTTAISVAKMLKNKKRLTVITNSIEVMVELADMHDWNIITTGGYLKGDSLAFVGTRTIADIANFYADKLIFSCKGLDMQRGILDSNDAFAQVKRKMVLCAKTKILATDMTKFDRTALAKIADIGEIDMVVTDTCPEEHWLEYFLQNETTCIYPK